MATEYDIYQKCPSCKGTGKIRQWNGQEFVEIDCDACGGDGKLNVGWLEKS